jgi:hypothetical protein
MSNVYIISVFMLFLFLVVDYLIKDITTDNEFKFKTNKFLLGIFIIVVPIINTVFCIYYMIVYFKKALLILNQDSKF